MGNVQHVFIHPWLNREERWGGLVVSIAPSVSLECSKGLAQLCRGVDAASIGGALPWFVPFASTGNEIDGWPLDRIVFLIEEPENSAVNQSWLASAETVRAAGGKVGVIAFPQHPLPTPGGTWDYVFLESSHARTAPPVKITALATQSVFCLSRIKNRQDFDWGIANHAGLLNTEFLLARAKEPSKPDMMRAHLLRLLSLVTQDADTHEIEEVFRQEPKLSYSLLRLVNSAALSLRTPISSFSQAISLLGRRQLQRWLQLLVYADPGGNGRANPLLQWAAMRGRLLELAFQHVNPPPEFAIASDSAFMVGIFSLLDVLLNLSMEEILSQLPVASIVKLALTERAGPLGELLCAIESAERQKFDAASQTFSDLGISCADYAQAQLEAIDWANKISQQTV